MGSSVQEKKMHYPVMTEAAILTHFAVNATHFFGFSYPMLAR
jgi:hypothetical protein